MPTHILELLNEVPWKLVGAVAAGLALAIRTIFPLWQNLEERRE